MSNNIKIYQTRAEWVFRDYKTAMENGFNLEAYDKVAEYNQSYELGETDDEILEDVFNKGNIGELSKMFKMRSITTSDLVDIDGRLYYCDDFGWKRINNKMNYYDFMKAYMEKWGASVGDAEMAYYDYVNGACELNELLGD